MQLQRDVRRLHSLPHYRQQFVAQGVEVRLVAQLGREGFQGLSRIVLPAVEAAVYESLYASAQGVEQSGYHEGRVHDGQVTLDIYARSLHDPRPDPSAAPKT